MAHTQDDGFHEIQLNGKQLVFLFMAATVVSVVIFLCGVLVGRSVRGQQIAVAQTAAVDEMPPSDMSAQGVQPITSIPPGQDPNRAAPAAEVEDLSYFNRLERRPQQAEPPTEAPPAPRDAAAKAQPRESATSSPPPAPPSTSARAEARAPAAPSGGKASAPGWVVQIASLTARSEADAMAKRVRSNGFEAYVQPPSTGSPNTYRVRVGPFDTRREAQSTASKLKKDLRLDSWVTNP